MAKIAAGMAGGADKAEASQAELVAEHGADLGAVGTLKEQIAMAVGQAREGGVEEQDILSVLEEAGENVDDALPQPSQVPISAR